VLGDAVATGKGMALEDGDIETALNAASQIGDDTSSAVRVARWYRSPLLTAAWRSALRWFKRGVQGAQIDSCDTSLQRNSDRLFRDIRSVAGGCGASPHCCRAPVHRRVRRSDLVSSPL